MVNQDTNWQFRVLEINMILIVTKDGDDDESQYQDDNVKKLNISNIEDIRNKFGYHP